MKKKKSVGLSNFAVIMDPDPMFKLDPLARIFKPGSDQKNVDPTGFESAESSSAAKDNTSVLICLAKLYFRFYKSELIRNGRKRFTSLFI